MIYRMTMSLALEAERPEQMMRLFPSYNMQDKCVSPATRLRFHSRSSVPATRGPASQYWAARMGGKRPGTRARVPPMKLTEELRIRLKEVDEEAGARGG
mmetsp:Transcript_7748/g.15819  ORF Transcript_7748/g.15819 Transcript_7748/m.15819 type:complete len:99 (-) Transcript_7748:119-415(-)